MNNNSWFNEEEYNKIKAYQDKQLEEKQKRYEAMKQKEKELLIENVASLDIQGKTNTEIKKELGIGDKRLKDIKADGQYLETFNLKANLLKRKNEYTEEDTFNELQDLHKRVYEQGEFKIELDVIDKKGRMIGAFNKDKSNINQPINITILGLEKKNS